MSTQLKYRVVLDLNCTVDIEVEAATEAEARELAMKTGLVSIDHDEIDPYEIAGIFEIEVLDQEGAA